MKKYALFALAAGTMFCSCNNDELTSENGSQKENQAAKTPIVFVANADNSGTKTVLDENDGVTVNWVSGDEVTIYGESEGDPVFGKYTAFENGSSTELNFSDEHPFEVWDNPQYAIYPSSAAISCSSEGLIEFELPETQYYSKNSFGNGANVAVGQVTSTDVPGIQNIYFKNVCGYLRLKLSVGDDESFMIRKIVLFAFEHLSGTFKADATLEAPTAVYDQEVDDGGKSITLDCGEGVELTSTATEFYFVLPAGALEQGFTVYILDEDGDVCADRSIDKELTIARNTVRAMQNWNISDELF